MSYFRQLHAVVLIVVGMAACATQEVNMDAPDEAFNQIKTWYYDEEFYEEAINKFNEFKSKYPYHRHTTEVELLIADSYYTQEKWAEASVTYEEFMTLHPQHKQYAFALYRNASCFYNQRNATVDRDQSPTKEAIEQFRRYLNRFPQGEKAQQAQKNLELCVEQLSAHSDFIADFYLWKELYHSALHKYLQIMEAWPNKLELHGKAMVNAAACYEQLAKQKTQDPDTDKNEFVAKQTVAELKKKGKDLAEDYLKRYPDGALRSRAKGLASRL